MSNSKSTQFIVITTRAYDSGWNRVECYTEVEAFAVAADLAERGHTGSYIVDIEGGTCLPFVALAQTTA